MPPRVLDIHASKAILEGLRKSLLLNSSAGGNEVGRGGERSLFGLRSFWGGAFFGLFQAHLPLFRNGFGFHDRFVVVINAATPALDMQASAAESRLVTCLRECPADNNGVHERGVGLWGPTPS